MFIPCCKLINLSTIYMRNICNLSIWSTSYICIVNVNCNTYNQFSCHYRYGQIINFFYNHIYSEPRQSDRTITQIYNSVSLRQLFCCSIIYWPILILDEGKPISYCNSSLMYLYIFLYCLCFHSCLALPCYWCCHEIAMISIDGSFSKVI